MTCAACSQFVEKTLASVPGVNFVSVNLNSGKAYIASDNELTWETVSAAVKKTGYQPLQDVPGEDELVLQARAAKTRVLTAWAITLPTMVLMILAMTGTAIPWLPIAESVAALLVFAGPGRLTLNGARIAIMHKHANMDVLVSLGAFAALSTAVLNLVNIPIRSFGSLASMLLAFHLTGRLLENYLRRKAGADLKGLMTESDPTAWVKSDNGYRELPLEVVKKGAVIRVRTGERVPLDCRVVSGHGALNEAMVTGESLPRSRGPGDEVVGGTVLEQGVLEMEVLRTGEDGFLARMIELMEQAQGTQVPLQVLADKIAGIFVPVVLALGLLSFFAWAVFYNVLAPILHMAVDIFPWVPDGAGPWSTAVFAAVSLMVVSCPCTLGLATPMAISVGTGLAARLGLLIKGGEALQTMGKLDVLLFDKTGTLTSGSPAVVWSNLSDIDKLAAGILESHSLHPLARAVRTWALPDNTSFETDNLRVEEVKEEAGKGISGKVGGIYYSAGRPEGESPLTGDFPEGCTIVEIRRENSIAGYIALTDPVRDDAAAIVKTLSRMGIQTIMATGDRENAAMNVAKQIGIGTENVRASLHPEDKLRIVQEFQQQGLMVGMMGDGINDAAALKAADIGFALSHGSDLSKEAGDVVIIRGGLERAVWAMEISKLITKKIRSNLVWAFAYNLLAIPAAGLALIHPLAAEAAMSISSVAVILNSIAIRGAWKRLRRRMKFEW